MSPTHPARRACAAGVLALFAAWLPVACSRKPADPVAALLADLERAGEARDAEAVAALLADDFLGAHGLDRAEALAQLRRHFAAYETIALEVYGVEQERDGAQASVRCVVEFSGRARRLPGLEGLLPPSAVYRFDLDVADSRGAWRVSRAAWEPVADEPGEGR